MRDRLISKLMFVISKDSSLDMVKLEEIKYGLETIYVLISKFLVIFGIALILNIVKELLLFIVFFNLIKSVSFGMHARSSKSCLIASTIVFISIPIISKFILIPNIMLALLFSFNLILMYKNSPADTIKRPIINPKRRLVFKYLSIFITIIFGFISILISNSFISNSLLFSITIQNFMISPLAYKIFNLPYNNYMLEGGEV